VAPGLESLDDADLIRGKILLAFERAEEMLRSITPIQRQYGNCSPSCWSARHGGRGNGEHPGGDVADGVGA